MYRVLNTDDLREVTSESSTYRRFLATALSKMEEDGYVLSHILHDHEDGNTENTPLFIFRWERRTS